MAVATTTTITNVVLSLLLMDPIRSQINRECVLLNLLPLRAVGDPISWTVKFRGRTAAAAIAQTAGAPTATSDVRERATLNVGEYSDTAGVTGRAQAAAALTLNPLGVANGNDLMADELRDAVGNVAETMATEIYSGSGSDHIIGMDTAIDSTGTYAGLAQGSYSEWASTETTSTLAALSFSSIETFLNTIYTTAGVAADLIVTTPTIQQGIKDLYKTFPGYVTEIPLRGETRKLIAGARAFLLDGIVPVVSDPRATAGVLYALNTNEIELCYMPQFTSETYAPDAIAAEIYRLTGATLRVEEVMQLMGRAMNGGILPFIKRLGATGNQENDQVIVYPQLRVKGRKFHGKITGIA